MSPQRVPTHLTWQTSNNKITGQPLRNNAASRPWRLLHALGLLCNGCLRRCVRSPNQVLAKIDLGILVHPQTSHFWRWRLLHCKPHWFFTSLLAFYQYIVFLPVGCFFTSLLFFLPVHWFFTSLLFFCTSLRVFYYFTCFLPRYWFFYQFTVLLPVYCFCTSLHVLY